MQAHPIMALVLASLLLSVPVHSQMPSDIKVEGTRLVEFKRSKGASLAGNDISWNVPARTFERPLWTRRGFTLYLSDGIGVLVPAGHDALAELRRRGGVALVRGTVKPHSDAKPGEPAYVVIVRDLNRRKLPKRKS